MMYLSRFELNRRLKKARSFMSNPQVAHAALKSCFPADEQKLLWRIDRLGHSVYVLVVSEAKPDFTHMSEQFGWLNNKGETIEYDTLFARLKHGDRYKFKLRGNPVARTDGKARALIEDDECRGWLLRQAATHGFSLSDPDFFIAGREVMEFKKTDLNDKPYNVTINAVTFEGVLTITDVEKFVDALKSGVGRAKTYGCGMLTIVKL
jgi:CRISPR system Cascade subunit CasE